MILCNECDEPYQAFGDCSGICEDCRDEIALRKMLEDMSDEEYANFMAKRRSLRITQVGLTNALLGLTRKVA